VGGIDLGNVLGKVVLGLWREMVVIMGNMTTTTRDVS
jgi:hypothetical protein